MFKNTFNLTRFYLKNSWLSSCLWVIGVLFMSIVVALAFNNIYSGEQNLVGMAETMKNPAMIALVGPIFDETNYTVGAMMSQMMLLFTGIAVAIMNIFLVVKHTRKDEESGRIEVVRSLPVGKLSDLAGTTIICFIVNLVIALLVGFGLYFLKIDTMDLTGSLLYGAGIGVIGILFGSVALLFAQISSTSRGAISYSFIFLGIMYLLRAVGDVSITVLSFISPLGMLLRTEVYVNNYFLPITILLVISTLVTLSAFYLKGIRDLGAGLKAIKPGKSEASKLLNSPFALALKLLKGTLIGWGITMFLAGISYGSIFGDIEKFLETSDMLKQMFLVPGVTYTFAEQFLSMLMVIMSVLTTVPVLIIILKIRSEEKKGRLDHLYAKKIAKSKVLSNYLIISIMSSIMFTVLFVFGIWGASYYVMEDPISFISILKAGVFYLPAIWVMIGIAILLISYLPKFVKLVWTVLGISFFVVYLGKILDIPSWVVKLTPYGNVPRLPVEEVTYVPLVVLLIISIGMIILGFIGYRKRDIENQ